MIKRQRLTEKIVKDTPPPAKGSRIKYDAEVKGFGVRVTSRGTRSFILNYWFQGRERRITIGQFPAWTVAAARDEAKRIRRDIDLGSDPLGIRTELRDAPTVGDLCDRYIGEHLPRKRESSRRNDLSIILRIIRPELGAEKVADIRFRDIDQLHQKHRKTPYAANRIVALLSKMFNLAIRWEWRTDNPARGIERFSEESKIRFLDLDEIRRLLQACDDHGNQVAANAVRFLLLTGCRRGEALGATWDQFDLERAEWIKPSSHTKQKRTHRAPLSDDAVALLREMRRQSNGDFVFPGRFEGSSLTDLKKSWASIRRRAGLNDVRLHDLRHTYASILASSGTSLPIIGALLGHTQPSTTAKYSHFYDDPLREATSRVSNLILPAGKADIERSD